LYKITTMNIDFLKEVLSLPSISSNESMVRDYILKFAEENQILSTVDQKGNVYLTKGSEKMTSGEYYPCVVSHMDTVHRSHIEYIINKERLDIVENDGKLTARRPNTDKQTGIGGDDKCGVYVCLEMFNKFDVIKGAFFVEEEIGMLGSQQADDKFFENVGYAIQFDAPSDNWISEVCSGVKLFDQEFKEEITQTLNESGYTKFSIDPFTDVNQLATKYDFNCLNLGCGYYRQHTDFEYVVIEEVSNSLKAGEKLITKLGLEKYTHNKKIKETILTENVGNHVSKPILNSSYGLKFYDEYDENANKIVDVVFDMIDEGYNKEDIKFEIGEMLYNNGIV